MSRREEQGGGSVPAPEAPDFIMLAAAQLRRVIAGIDGRATTIREQSPGESGEWDPEVRQARLDVADRLIALAEIQYSLGEGLEE